MESIVEVGYLYGFYSQLLSERQRTLLDFHVNADMSISEIADQMGISRQGVHETLINGKRKLFELESRLGLAKRYTDVLSKLTGIKALLEQSRYDLAKTELQKLIQSWED